MSLAAAGMLTLLALPGQTTATAWEALEARRAVITGVEIVVRDVFDLSRASENNWISRLANAAHVQTRRRVVSRELLFAAGDVVDAARIRDTERNLRRYAFVREARIVPVVTGDDGVVVRIEVIDAWSLLGNADLTQRGGNVEWSARLDEVNVLGTGKRVFVEREHTIERDASALGYIDPQVLGSRWVLSAAYGDLSDGSSRLFVFERQYFAIDTPYSMGAAVATSERRLTQYNDGAAVYVIPIQRETASMFASRAYRRRGRTAERVGLIYRADSSRYDAVVALRPGRLPDPDTSTRRVRSLAATWALVQDRSLTFLNFARIGRTEDYNIGWIVSGAAGYALEALGSGSNAPIAEIAVRKGWSSSADGLILADAAVAGRRDPEGWRNVGGRASVTMYRRAPTGQTLAAQIGALSTTRPDVADWLYLGGRDGLRGYMDNFLAGDRRVTFSIEDRVLTGWRPLGLFQAGFVAYLDAGAIRRADTGRWSRAYANVGGGLRFGVLKSGRGNLMQVSVAVPLVRERGMDRALLVLGSSAGF